MSAFRPLVPSDRPVQAFGSLSSESSLQDDPRSGSDSATGKVPSPDYEVGVGGEEAAKRRRVPLTVSQRACNECRHARQRCDGEKARISEPQRDCTRCRQRRLKCIFEESTKQQKEDLIEQLKNGREVNDILRTQLGERDQTIAQLQEIKQWHRKILQEICCGHLTEQIIFRMRDKQSHEALAVWLHQVAPRSTGYEVDPFDAQTLRETLAIFEADCEARGELQSVEGDLPSKEPWTSVTMSSRLVMHLLDLYFAYVHPIHMLFDETGFRRDYQNSCVIHCSRPLLNAVCAMACFIYEMSEDQQELTPLQKSLKIAMMGRAFINEAKETLLNLSHYDDLTTVQTFAVLFLVELSSGRATTAISYLKIALEGLVAVKDSPQTAHAKELSLMGLQVLRTFSLTSMHEHLLSPFPNHYSSLDEEFLRSDENVLRLYYRSPGQTKIAVPTHSILTANAQTELFRIIGQGVAVYWAGEQQVTAEVVCGLYQKYLAWENKLPLVLGSVKDQNGPLPHVLYLHVQYQTAIIQHLGPIVQSGFFEGLHLDKLRELVVSHAWKAIEMLKILHNLYTARYLMPMLSFSVAQIADALVVHVPRMPRMQGSLHSAHDAVEFCVQLLGEARNGFPLCGPLQKLLIERAVENRFQLSHRVEEVERSLKHIDMGSRIDACSRLHYSQPLELMKSRIDPAIADDWPSAWGRHKIGSVASLLNAA